MVMSSTSLTRESRNATRSSRKKKDLSSSRPTSLVMLSENWLYFTMPLELPPSLPRVTQSCSPSTETASTTLSRKLLPRREKSSRNYWVKSKSSRPWILMKELRLPMHLRPKNSLLVNMSSSKETKEIPSSSFRKDKLLPPRYFRKDSQQKKCSITRVETISENWLCWEMLLELPTLLPRLNWCAAIWTDRVSRDYWDHWKPFYRETSASTRSLFSDPFINNANSPK